MRAKMISLVLLCLLLTALAWAQDSINVSTLGQYDYWYDANDVVKFGSYAYLVGYVPTGLRIMDVSNPAAPVEVGHCPLPNYGHSVAVHGAFAYVNAYQYPNQTLYVVDISNPAEPQIMGQCAILCLSGYYCMDIVVAYPYVYTANSYYGVNLIDVSNPVSPVVVDTLETPGYPSGLAIADSRLYVAEGEAGFHIYDISNPLSPIWLGYYRTPNFAREITVQGSLAYILDGYDEYTPAAGLMILDVSNPAHPTLLSSYGAYIRCGDIQVSGDYAYLAGSGLYSLHLRIIDVSDPLAPQEVCLFAHDGNSSSVCVEGSQLYLGGDGLTILDVTNPPNPVWISQFYHGYGARELAVRGSYAYVVNYYLQGLDVFDISDPSDPEWLSFCPAPSNPRNVALSWPYAYLADLGGGLRIINISNPQEPTEVSFYDPVSPSLTVSDVALDSPYAYLAGGSGGLIVLDVSDPVNPHPAGSFATVQPYLIKVTGSYAYTAETWASPFDGMRIFSLADPIHPMQMGSLTFAGTVLDMDVEGDYAYITTSSTLYVINVSNPMAPTLTFSSTLWDGYSLDAVGPLLYVVESDFFVLNMANLANPFQMGFYNISNTAYGVMVVDSIAYVGRDYYFTTFDCSDCFGMVGVTLQPLNPPIHIPVQGGGFQYTITVGNSLVAPQTFDLWIMVRMPNQTWYGPVQGPLTLTLPGGTVVTRLRTQLVPPSAPAGTYLYEARVGDYPGQIIAIDNFAFAKNRQGEASGIETWTCGGEPFPGEEAVSNQPSSFRPQSLQRFYSYQLRAKSCELRDAESV